MKNILAALLVLVLFQSSAHATDKIRIAVPDPNAAYMTFPLAQKKGFLAAAGFDGEIVLMRGTLTIPALNAGDIDYLTGCSRDGRRLPLHDCRLLSPEVQSHGD